MHTSHLESLRMPNALLALLGNTYDLAAEKFLIIKRTMEPYNVEREGKPEISSAAKFHNSHEFDIEWINSPVSADIGSANEASSQF